MKAINITERIRQIKDHIGRANLKTAFNDLEDLIRSIEGLDVENEQEREFLNQLITIKARFNSFHDSKITGTGGDQIELNQITNSLLSLTDSVHELLANNPDLIIPKTPEEITANLVIPAETVATTHSLPTPPPSQGNNGGCLFSFSKSADQTNVNVQANWLRILGGLGIFILVVALGLKLILGMDGCGQSTPSKVDNGSKVKPPPTTITDPTLPEKAKLDIVIPINSSNAIQKMATMLSDRKSDGRKEIKFPNIKFDKNSINLNPQAKKELDNMAMILMQVPDQRIILSATVGPGESTSYKGNKEITLGDVRARKMFEYLKSKGIPITRMEFEGGGVSDPQRVIVEMR